MKAMFSLGICLLFAVSIFGQVPEDQETAQAVIEDVTLAKDNGAGKPGEITSEFSPKDTPIHCRIQLNSYKVVTVKMQIVAIEVEGLKAGSKSVVISYKTNGKQNIVNFRAVNEEGWSPGKYKMELSLENKLEKSLDFTIIKSSKTQEIKPALAFLPKSKKATPRKSKKRSAP